MSSIAGYTFAEMRGEKLQPASDEVATLARPGTDGDIYRIEPAKTRIFEKLTAELYTLKANANLASQGYIALKGTLVTVVDELDYTGYNILVMDVQNITVQPVISPSASWANYVVRARWVLKPTV